MKKSIKFDIKEDYLSTFDGFLDEIVSGNLLDSSTIGAFSVLCFQVIEYLKMNEAGKANIEVTASTDSIWVNWTIEQEAYNPFKNWMQTEGKDYFNSLNSIYMFQDENYQFGFELQFTGLQQKLTASRRLHLVSYLGNKKHKHINS